MSEKAQSLFCKAVVPRPLQCVSEHPNEYFVVDVRRVFLVCMQCSDIPFYDMRSHDDHCSVLQKLQKGVLFPLKLKIKFFLTCRHYQNSDPVTSPVSPLPQSHSLHLGLALEALPSPYPCPIACRMTHGMWLELLLYL